MCEGEIKGRNGEEKATHNGTKGSEMYRGEGRPMGAQSERVGKWEGGSEEGKRGSGHGMSGW